MSEPKFKNRITHWTRELESVPQPDIEQQVMQLCQENFQAGLRVGKQYGHMDGYAEGWMHAAVVVVFVAAVMLVWRSL